METMLALIRFIFIVGGIGYLVTESTIFSVLRVDLLKLLRNHPSLQSFFATLVYCAPCSGFWIALVAAKLGLYPWDGWLLEAGIAGVATGLVWNHLSPRQAFELEHPFWALESEHEKHDATKES